LDFSFEIHSESEEVSMEKLFIFSRASKPYFISKISGYGMLFLIGHSLEGIEVV
jgi:hypothetical protein